jgi:hypothetical protein
MTASKKGVDNSAQKGSFMWQNYFAVLFGRFKKACRIKKTIGCIKKFSVLVNIHQHVINRVFVYLCSPK